MRHDGPEMTREVSGCGRRYARCGIVQELTDAAQAGNSRAVLSATKGGW